LLPRAETWACTRCSSCSPASGKHNKQQLQDNKTLSNMQWLIQRVYVSLMHSNRHTS
jgi:hypothetical protein